MSTRLALYRDADSLLTAAGRLRAAGFEQLELISPVPLKNSEAVLGKKHSGIKYFSFYGGIIGALFGFTLAAGTALIYQIPTGGRPIIPLPPYLIISYEFTILFGVLATLIGFFISARLPALNERAYAPEASVDRFVLVVTGLSAERANTADTELALTGAEEIRILEELS